MRAGADRGSRETAGEDSRRPETDHNNMNNPSIDALSPPSPLLLALEWRALWEYGTTLAATPLLSLAPRGDGHPVLVLPGLAAGDFTTLPLRRFLRNRGYRPHRWRLGINYGARPGVLDASLRRVRALRRRYGQKISVIGWSLGGIYARELAKLAADDVRFVITLGAPFTGDPKATHVWRLYQLASGQRVGDPELHEPLREPPPVPSTSIFSRSDGVVAWQCCTERVGPQTENIEVISSHCGLGMNAAVLYAIADRLAQPQHAWRPFDRTGWRSLIYRDPARPAGPLPW